jgi:hypothetical protein
MAEFYGKLEGTSHGYGGSMQLSTRSGCRRHGRPFLCGTLVA